VFRGIGHQVPERLGQPASVGDYACAARPPVGAARGPPARERGPSQRLEVVRCGRLGGTPAPARGGQVVQRHAQALNLRVHDLRVRSRPGISTSHSLTGQGQRGERAAQLVLGVGDELQPAAQLAPASTIRYKHEHCPRHPSHRTAREVAPHSASVSL
jgi:hypothetical protein